MLTEHQIRILRAGFPQDEPEIRYAMRIKAWWLVAVIGGAAIAACLVEAVRALPA